MTRNELVGRCYSMAESLITYGYYHDPEKIVDSSHMGDYVVSLGRNTVARIGLIVADTIETIKENDDSYRTVKYKQGSVWLIDL